MRPTRRAAAAACVTAVVLLAGCGSGDGVDDVAVEDGDGTATGDEVTDASDDEAADASDDEAGEADGGATDASDGTDDDPLGEDGSGSTATEDDGAGDGGADGEQLPGGATLVAPSPRGTLQTRAVPVERMETVGDTTIRLFFSKGVEPCDVLDDVVVDESGDTVEVTVLAGRSIGARDDVACIQVLRAYAVDVELSAPLDGREVVDASGLSAEDAGGVDDGT